jgi:hypothetical protein
LRREARGWRFYVAPISHIAEQTMMRRDEDALRRFNKEARVEIQLLGGLRKVRVRVVWKVWAIHRSSVWREKVLHADAHPNGATGCEHYLAGYALAVLAVRLDALGDWNSPKREELPLRHGRKVLKQWSKEVNSKRQ